MKKKLFFTCLLAAFAGMGSAAAQKTVTIGTGTDSTVSAPFNTVYKYSLVEQLYMASELNIPAGSVITSLSFQHAPSSKVTINLDRKVTVYLKNTKKSSFSSESDFLTPMTYEKVYEGKFYVNAAYSGWVTLHLDIPFVYTGENLMVIFDDNTGTFVGQSHYFRCHNTTNAKRLAYYGSTNPHPHTDSLMKYSGNRTTSWQRANIRIGYTGCVTNPAVIGGTDSIVTSPTNTVYKYSLVENLYLASELNIPTNAYIKSISYEYVRTAGATTNLNRKVVVYMANTSQNSFSSTTDYIPPTAEVYNGTLSASASGWITINLDKSFVYTGENLMIAFDDNTGATPDQQRHKFRGNTTATNTRLAYYSDSINPDISSLDSYRGNSIVSKQRANVRIKYTPNSSTATLPYSCDFTNSTENGNWILKNVLDDTRAAWRIADGKLFTNGHHFNSAPVTVLAERLLQTFYYDSITVSFECSINGEAGFDYVAVFLAPISYWQATTEADATKIDYLQGQDQYDLPYILHFGNPASVKNTKLTQSGRYSVTIPHPKTMQNCRLIFVWRNDSKNGTGEGAVIRNISVTGKNKKMEYTPKSTAQWYGYAAATHNSPTPVWNSKFISFTMNDLENVRAAASSAHENYAAAYAEGYVWYITSSKANLIRKQLNPDTHTLYGKDTVMASYDIEKNVISMSYNPVDKKMYLINGSCYLYRVDLAYPNQYTVIGHLADSLWTFAIDKNGEAYGITIRTGNLIKVNLKDASTTLVGSTGINHVSYVQSMCFDYNTGELFWAHCGSYTNKFYMYCVNPTTGEAKTVGVIGGGTGTELTGLFMVPSANDIADVKGDNLEVYPNPATDMLHVKGISENVTISMYDATGRLMLRTTAAKGETAQISTATLAEGLYFLKAGTAVRKVVISR